MENMERFTPSYAIAYAILIGTANLRFGKEDYFYVFVFFGLFYKRNFFRVPIRCGNTRGSLGGLEIAWKHSWKFGKTRNSVETLVEVWENSK